MKEQGGILNNYNIVDFAFGIAPGVFAIVTSDSKEVNELMKYLGMGKGPNYVMAGLSGARTHTRSAGLDTLSIV